MDEFVTLEKYPEYAVSKFGEVKRVVAKARAPIRVLKPGVASNGYPTVQVGNSLWRGTRTVHSLVAETFLGPCPDGMEVNHKDGNRLNPHLENLEYVTRSGNIRHAIYGDAMAYTHRNKLSESDVSEIKRLLLAGAKGRDIAGRFSISEASVSMIKRGHAWAFVKC